MKRLFIILSLFFSLFLACTEKSYQITVNNTTTQAYADLFYNDGSKNHHLITGPNENNSVSIREGIYDYTLWIRTGSDSIAYIGTMYLTDWDVSVDAVYTIYFDEVTKSYRYDLYYKVH
jgi:hypothetical protein